MSIDNQRRARAVCIPDASEVATTGVVNAIDRKRILRIGCEVIRKTDSFDHVAQGRETIINKVDGVLLFAWQGRETQEIKKEFFYSSMLICGNLPDL
ncbi:MAG: hypothetical protein DIKNOCCD_00893 [bacterium]|nr:hypothetical protein [bacterium]